MKKCKSGTTTIATLIKSVNRFLVDRVGYGGYTQGEMMMIQK